MRGRGKRTTKAPPALEEWQLGPAAWPREASSAFAGAARGFDAASSPHLGQQKTKTTFLNDACQHPLAAGARA
eukprot:5129332-Pyramimonas_sp.AAC.1